MGSVTCHTAWERHLEAGAGVILNEGPVAQCLRVWRRGLDLCFRVINCLSVSCEFPRAGDFTNPIFAHAFRARKVPGASSLYHLTPRTKSHILLCLVARWRNVIVGFSNNLSTELEGLSCSPDSEPHHFISLPVNQACVGADASPV